MKTKITLIIDNKEISFNCKDKNIAVAISNLINDNCDVECFTVKQDNNTINTEEIVNKLSKHFSYLDTKSEEYKLGGTICNCWGETYNVSEDVDDYSLKNEYSFKEILKFFELDFYDLKKYFVYEDIVEESIGTEGDYYGGSYSYKYYFYDIKEMLRLIIKYEFNNKISKDILDKLEKL